MIFGTYPSEEYMQTLFHHILLEYISDYRQMSVTVLTYISRLVQDTNIIARLVVGAHHNDEADKQKFSVVTLTTRTIV